MSTQDGPYWYPSKQFVHSPPPPPGAPASSGPLPDQPRWTQPDLIVWVVAAIASGVLALICAIVTIVNAQNLDRLGSEGSIDPHSLGSALTAGTGALVFGLIAATCTVVSAVVRRRTASSA